MRAVGARTHARPFKAAKSSEWWGQRDRRETVLDRGGDRRVAVGQQGKLLSVGGEDADGVAAIDLDLLQVGDILHAQRKQVFGRNLRICSSDTMAVLLGSPPAAPIVLLPTACSAFSLLAAPLTVIPVLISARRLADHSSAVLPP